MPKFLLTRDKLTLVLSQVSVKPRHVWGSFVLGPLLALFFSHRPLWSTCQGVVPYHESSLFWTQYRVRHESNLMDGIIFPKFPAYTSYISWMRPIPCFSLQVSSTKSSRRRRTSLLPLRT